MQGPVWPIKVAFVITTGQSGNGKGLVPILLYIVFVAVGVFIASEVGYLLSASEKEQSTSRRCRRSHQVHRRRAIKRRQRVRCRFEG